MRRATGAALIVAALIAAGCVRYSLVEPRTRTIADRYTVEPQIAWSAETDGPWCTACGAEAGCGLPVVGLPECRSRIWSSGLG